MPRSAAALTPALQELVGAIRREVARGEEAAGVARAVAGHLERALDDPDLLAPRHAEPDDEAYCQHVLHVEEDGSFSVVALVWLAGQETPPHDHVAWCVPGVYRGREEETRYRLVGGGDGDGGRAATAGESGARLVEAGRSTNEAGDVVALTPPGDIHRVRNPGPGTAISIHVYGADIGELGSSIRRRYDLPVRPAG